MFDWLLNFKIKMGLLTVLLVFVAMHLSTCFSSITEEEPQCISRFDYDFKVLKKLLELEQLGEQLTEENQQQREVTEQHSSEIGQLKSDNERLLSVISAQVTGSTYVRWGRTSCPENGTELVYTGYAGGSHFTNAGAAVNYLCLPSDPLWGEYDDTVENKAMVYGAEYEIQDANAKKFFGKSLFDGDVPCSVCNSIRSRVVMIPGRNACYDGWTMEYAGYLTAGYHGHTAASEYACLDENAEKLEGGHTSLNGVLFYQVEGRCGSLRCPPYVDGRELACVVCTK